MYELISTDKDIGKFQLALINSKSAFMGFDIETTGLDVYSDKVVLIQVELDGTEYLLDVLHCNSVGYFLSLLNSCNKTLVGFNLKFDLRFIKHKFDLLLTNIYDLFLAEVIANNGLTGGSDRYPSLKFIANKYLSLEIDKAVRASFYEGDHPELLTEEKLLYAAGDVTNLVRLRTELQKILINQKQEAVISLENRLLPVVVMMELQGITLDADEWRQLARDAESRRSELEKEIREYIILAIDPKKFSTALELVTAVGLAPKLVRDKKYLATISPEYALSYWVHERLNINSPNQLKLILNLLGIHVENTNDDTLAEITDVHLIDMIREYREYAKRISTYGESFLENINPVTGKVHSKFNQLGTETGRFSSDSPNLQNIPRLAKYRACFKAMPGYVLICCDYKQQEYKLVGDITGDELIIEAYTKGLDMHSMTASMVFEVPLQKVTKEQRNTAKGINFGTLYGGYAKGLSRKMHIPYEFAVKAVDTINNGYKKMVSFREHYGNQVVKVGYSKTLLGRRRYFLKRDIFERGSKEMLRYIASVHREGYNMLIQGTGAEAIKQAMLTTFYNSPFSYEQFHVLLQIHDELVFEVKEELVTSAKKFIEDSMNQAMLPYLKKIKPEVESAVSTSWIKA